MSKSFDVLIKEAEVYLDGRFQQVDLGIQRGKIAEIGNLHADTGREVIRAGGLSVFPGFIDSQVHFREPGAEHKEDLETGSRAALLGGVTTYFEMPNTSPPTISAELLDDKLNRAAGRSWANYGFFVGATKENISVLPELERLPGCVGIKVFVGSSTGNLLVDSEEDLRAVLQSGRRRVALHCEDQARLQERKSLIKKGDTAEMHPVWRDEVAALMATRRVVEMALEYCRPVHILHVSSAAEVKYLSEVKRRPEATWNGIPLVTCEVTPNHILFSSPECYRAMGTLVQMNPPIRDESHRIALCQGLRSGLFDAIGSDHAPHTISEKEKPYPESPSGMPGVQTIVPLMLDQVQKGEFPLSTVVTALTRGPAEIYGIHAKGEIAVGKDADLSIIDRKLSRKVQGEWLASRCHWSPYEGRVLKGWPVGAMIQGALALWDGQLVGAPKGRSI